MKRENPNHSCSVPTYQVIYLLAVQCGQNSDLWNKKALQILKLYTYHQSQLFTEIFLLLHSLQNTKHDTLYTHIFLHLCDLHKRMHDKCIDKCIDVLAWLYFPTMKISLLFSDQDVPLPSCKSSLT